MGLHHLDHQLAQSGNDAGTGAAVSAHPWRPRAVDFDPDGIRWARAVVRAGLCRDAGRPHRLLPGIDAAREEPGSRERDPHPGLALRIGGILDPRGFCRRTVQIVALGRSAGDRICLAGGAVLDTGIGRLHRRGLAVEGGHIAERCAGFIIIALGESIVVTGATFGDLTWTAENVTAFVSPFLGSIAMWWIYFHKGAEAGSELISKSSDSGRLARLAYTYLHMPIVAGIILWAVADELVLKHPHGHSDARTVVSAIGGPLLFLIGTILFKLDIRGFLQLSHGAGIIPLCVLAWFASALTPLMLSLLTSLLLIVVAVWESLSLRARPAE